MITNYFRPQSLEQTLTLLTQPATHPMCGGTWLNQPHDEQFAVVDLQALGLNNLREVGNNLEIEACVTLQQLFESVFCPEALRQALRVDAATATEAGLGHTLVIKTDGTMWVWGNNAYGQLGTGNLNWTNVPLTVSTAGNADQQAPTVPTGLTLAPSPNPFILNWTASTDNIGVMQYRIYRSGATTALSSVASTSYTDGAGLVTDTYTVAACDAAGNCSAKTAAVGRDVTLPSPSPSPTPLVRRVVIYQLYLDWTAATDNVGVTRYDIFQTLPIITASMVGSSTTNSFTAIGLTNTNYSYKVRACDAAGNCTAPSTTASVAIAPLTLPDLTAPSAPTGVAAVVSGNTIIVSWTLDSIDPVGGSGFRDYRIYTMRVRLQLAA